MSDIDKTRRKIKQLRALADSTTFPEEARSARAKADKLEAELGPVDDHGPDARAVPRGHYGSSHAADAFAYAAAYQQAQRQQFDYGAYMQQMVREDYLNSLRRAMAEMTAEDFKARFG